jgi:hypothetical protein
MVIFANLSRYEVALSRSLLRNLHELQRLQAVRAGERVPAPAVVDVDIKADEPVSAPAVVDADVSIRARGEFKDDFTKHSHFETAAFQESQEEANPEVILQNKWHRQDGEQGGRRPKGGMSLATWDETGALILGHLELRGKG